MACAIGNPYIIQSGDTLYDVAQKQLGNGDRWREIIKPDGTSFTDSDISNLQPGQEVCLPDGSITPPVGSFANIVSRQTYDAMFSRRNSLYAYNSLVVATQKYAQFCNEGSDEQRKREAAAFLANIA